MFLTTVSQAPSPCNRNVIYRIVDLCCALINVVMVHSCCHIPRLTRFSDMTPTSDTVCRL